MTSGRRTARSLAAVAVVGTLALTGCSSSDEEAPTGAASPVTQAEIDEALSTPTTLDLWAWVPDIQNEVDLFEEKYPDIDVNIINQGGATQQYVKLRAAIKAGKGVPDVAQIGYDRIPSFTQTKDLLDLTPYGAEDVADQFVDGIWSQVEQNGGIWAIPQDSGPMGTLYRTDIFEAAGVAAPTTWEEFATAAETIKSATGSYITNLPGNDMPQMLGFFSQAGAEPFGYDGEETVTIDVDNNTTQQVVQYWQDLIQADLVATDPDYTDGWYQGLSRGSYASWLTAAWGPTFLQGTAENTSGLWSAVELPQWEAGDTISANWGGSANSVMAASDNPIAAYELAKFINTDAESTLKLANEQFLFPTTKATLEDPAFTEQASEFYGGQQVNKFFAEVSATVPQNQQWLPFMDYVNTAYDDTLGKAIADGGDMVGALSEWQTKIVDYATSQGFTVQ